MNPAGRSRVESDIVDLSVLVATGLKGIAALVGVTSWGDFGKSVLVGNWEEFKKNFGGLRSDTLFPSYCKLMLERGAKLRIGRTAHFTDNTDKSTVVADKATATRTTVETAETRATGIVTVTTRGATGDTYDVVTGGYSWTTLQTSGMSTIALVHAGIVSTINGGSDVHGYEAAIVSGHVEITAPIGTGATANGQPISVRTSGAGVITQSAFSGGVSELLYAGDITFESAYATDALNGSTIEIRDAASAIEGKIDIITTIYGYPTLGTVVKNLNRTFTPADKTAFNLKSQHIKIVSYTDDINNGTLTLADGTLDISGLADSDFIGDASAMTGIHSFDDATDFVRIAVLEKATPAVDNALLVYVTARQDCRAILRSPLGIDGNTAIDYREGTGIYSHTAIDTWLCSMIYGDINFSNPDNVGADIVVPAAMGAITAASYKDNKAFEWFAAAGAQRGKIIGTLGVEYNLASPARSLEFDNVDLHGINAVVNDADYGVVYWGNSTMQKADTLLKHENVADLMIYLTRTIRPSIKIELFNPNDVETWKSVYRKVKKVMDLVQKNRGVWKWLYQGDQDIDKVENAVVNSSSNIDAGQYVFNLFVAPKVGMKYIGMRVVVTNSDVKFEEVGNV